jgi:hypothetical protein
MLSRQYLSGTFDHVTSNNMYQCIKFDIQDVNSYLHLTNTHKNYSNPHHEAIVNENNRSPETLYHLAPLVIPSLKYSLSILGQG